MSIQNLSTIWAQAQAAAAPQSTAGTTSSQSAQDWLTNLLSATGTAAAGSSDASMSTATLSDQMQALLVQLQGGNTTAPDASTTASASPTQAVSGHHHHHHHGGADAIDQNVDDIGATVASDLSDADGSGLDTTPGGFMQGVKDVLTNWGSAAIKGAATGATLAAI
jgi:hypothetical protein